MPYFNSKTFQLRHLTIRFLFIVSVLVQPTPSFAQAESPFDKINAEATKSNITIQHLRGNISVLMGSGGNIVVLTGPQGKLLVDAGIAVSRMKIQDALNSLDSSQIKYLINTHWHWDHTDGNEWLHETGATIISHPNTLKHLSETTRVEEWNHTFASVPLGGRPTVTIKNKTMHFDGNTVVMENYGVGHTDGDLLVLFKDQDVLVLGDIFWNGIYPFIDNGVGGNIDGVIRWVNKSLDFVTEKTIVVAGHGPVGNRADLIEYRDMLVTIRDNVSKLKRGGKSLDEVIPAKPTAAYDTKFGNSLIDPAFFTRLVYAGV